MYPARGALVGHVLRGACSYCLLWYTKVALTNLLVLGSDLKLFFLCLDRSQIVHVMVSFSELSPLFLIGEAQCQIGGSLKIFEIVFRDVSLCCLHKFQPFYILK